jgi:hypothetical protein
MIPDTLNGLPAMACVSAMQKTIRRGMEREAMEFAVELMHTSKAFHSMVCKRLEIISHEDIDTQADPAIVPFVATAVAQAMKWYDPEKIGASRMAIGNAIRLMCTARKRAVRAITLLRRSGCGRCWRALRRRSPTGRTTSTRWQAASWGVVSIISARKARSWSRRRQPPTPTRTKLIGCGRSSSRAVT